jgi:tRNA/tmRNA/rRNA uracil-C5-methylase (TrmA/RlmC/RlmD family)
MPDAAEKKPETDFGTPCPPACPGCAHRGLSPAASIAQKMDWLYAKLEAWPETLMPMEAPPPFHRLGYRETVRLSTRWQNGRWEAGLLSGDAVISIPACPVHGSRVNAALACLLPALPPPPEFPMRYYVQSGAQVTLVVKSRRLSSRKWVGPDLVDRLKGIGIEGVWVNCHPCTGKQVFAKNGWDLLWGAPRSIDYRLAQQGLLYGPTSFKQLIPGLYNRALEAADAFLEPGAGDLFIDLYCGIGCGLARWTSRTSRAVGVEQSGESAFCAAVNAPGALVYRGACRHRLPQLTDGLLDFSPDKRLLFANPPRTGLEPEVRRWIGGVMQPERLAYLSCSAGTLRRDLLELESHGYRAETIIPYDFFPGTHHVETLALVRRT